MKKTLAVLLAIVCVISLCACGNAGSNSKAYGVYKAKTLGGLEEMLGEEALEGFTLEIKDDKKIELTFDGETSTGEYTIDGEKFVLKDAEDEIEGTYKDGVITIEIEGIECTFEKDAE